MRTYIKKPGSTKKSNGHWKVKENCITEAQKYSTLREWQLKSPGSLIAAYKYGWIYDCCLHMKKNTPVVSTTKDDEFEKKPPISQRIRAEKKVMEFLGL